MFAPTADGRAGNMKSLLELRASVVKAAVDERNFEKVLDEFGKYQTSEDIVRRDGENLGGNIIANNVRKEIFDYMTKHGYDPDDLTY